MELEHARRVLLDQQTEVRKALGELSGEQGDDREAEAEADNLDDRAAPMDAEVVDDALAGRLRDKLAAVERALTRVDDGTYGRSVRSGDVIPDARLEADPTAELTVEEAAADEDARR